MSVQAVVAHVAAATPTPIPSASPSPSVTPVVHAALALPHADLVSSVSSFVGAHQAEVVLLGSALLVLLQSLINKFPWLKGEADALSQQVQDIKRELIALGLPAVLLAIGSLLQGTNLMGYLLELWAAAKGVFNVWKLAKVSAQRALSNTSVQTTVTAPEASTDGVG